MITFTTDTRIERPVEEVFDYVSDPLNLPSWNSAVQAVRKTSAGEDAVGATYSMQRELPTGHAVNELEIVARERPRECAIRTTAGPTPFVYRYQFSAAEKNGTLVEFDAEVELPRPAAFVPTLARRAVKKGVDDNLKTLKRILEGHANQALSADEI